MGWVEDYFDAWARHAPAADPASGAADMERLLAFMDPTVRYEDVPTEQVFLGHDGIRDMCATALQMAPDLRFELVSTQESGDQYAFEVEAHGQHDGEVAGMPATGKRFVVRGVNVGRRGPDGLIVSHRSYWDLVGFHGQVGLRPGG